MNKNHKTTDNHMKYFRARVACWAHVFGLVHARIVFHHKNFYGPDSLAWYISFDDAAFFYVGLSRSWGLVPVTRERLNRVALHEVIHLFVEEFCLNMKYRKSFDKHKEKFVTSIENIILGLGE